MITSLNASNWIVPLTIRRIFIAFKEINLLIYKISESKNTQSLFTSSYTMIDVSKQNQENTFNIGKENNTYF